MATGCNEDLAFPPIPEPEGGIESIGTGAWNKPMSAYQALIGSVNDSIPEPWVTGYIVGYVNTAISSTLSEATFGIPTDDNPCSVATNMLISVRPDETDWEKCASVQLPSGAARSALNLADHPENLGRQVCVKGTTGSKYCGVYGVRSVSEYNWGDKGIQSEPEGPVEPLPCLWQSFSISDKLSTYILEGWQNVAVAGGLSGWYIREFSGNNYITVSAYLGNDAGGPYENWLIAPPVNIDKANKKTLTFVTQAAYPAENSILEVYALDDVDLAKAKRTKLAATIPTPPANGYSDWVSSGTVDLSAFSGVVYIAWRYYSEKGGNGNSTTYGIDNINIGDAPEVDPVTPPSETDIYSGLNPDSDSCDWTFHNVTLGAGLSYVWSWKEYNGSHYLNASAYASGSAKEALSYAISPVIDLSGKTEASVSFEHAAKFQTTLRDLCGFCVREAGTDKWTDLSIKKWPGTTGWTFVNSGDMDLKDFLGKKIELAFRYGSSAAGADTWEVKSVKVTGK